MANPCQFLQDQVDALADQIQDLTDLLKEVPPRQRGTIMAQIRTLRAQQQTVLGRLRACNSNPTPYLLQMDGIEVTQAIQDMQHSVALIAGKGAAVRVYLSYYASPDIQVRGELLARSASGAFYTIASNNQPSLSSSNAGNLQPKRLNASLSLNFLVPGELISAGRWDFSLNSLVNVSTGSPLSVTGASTRRVTFVNGGPLRVRVLGVRYSTGSPPAQHIPSDLDYKLLFSWLRRAYPVPQVIATHALIDISPSAPAVFGSGDVNAQLAAIRALDVSGGTDKRTHYYGFVSDAGFFMRGSAAGIPASPDPSTVASGPTGSATWGWDTDGSYGDWYGGHEIGHTFGRFHPGSGCGESSDDPHFPYPNGQLAASDATYCGFDVGDASLGISPAALPATQWHDVMTYCQRQWLSAYTYDGIRTRLGAEDALAAGPAPGLGGGAPDRRFPERLTTSLATRENFIHVVARVNLTKHEGQIRYVQPVSNQHAEATGIAGPVIIRFRTAKGKLVNEYRVPLKLDSDSDKYGEEAGLVDIVLSASPDARQVELIIGDKTVDTFRGEGSVRRIKSVRKLAEPSALGLSWEHEAAAEEGTSYAIQASTDEGATWFTVAVGLKTPEFKFDAKQFPGVKSVHIRVLTTNGFSQTVEEGEVFDLSEHAQHIKVDTNVEEDGGLVSS
jgi:hypothetical protein